jgi:steroid 5-alpha reductase family enzyme
MPTFSAAIISASQTFFTSANSINSLTTAALFLTPRFLSSDTKYGISPVFMIRTVDYIIGLSGEIISETQRKEFRDDPKNTGKLYTVGLFYFARYVNYGSNLIWRVVYAVARGWWVYGLLCLAMFAGQFLIMVCRLWIGIVRRG